jgi:hypothetical protein
MEPAVSWGEAGSKLPITKNLQVTTGLTPPLRGGGGSRLFRGEKDGHLDTICRWSSSVCALDLLVEPRIAMRKRIEMRRQITR